MTTPESITCPRCQRTSHHPQDVRERYCGACHQFHDIMFEPWQRAYLERFLDGVGGRPAEDPPPLEVTFVGEDRVSPILRAMRERFHTATDEQRTHFYVGANGEWWSVLDETHVWQAEPWKIGYPNKVDVRDPFGQAVAERDPWPCGWHQRDGFRLGGAAADVELPPMEGGWPLW